MKGHIFKNSAFSGGVHRNKPHNHASKGDYGLMERFIISTPRKTRCLNKIRLI